MHLFSILNTKQTNDGIFSNKTEGNFDLAKNVRKGESPTLSKNLELYPS